MKDINQYKTTLMIVFSMLLMSLIAYWPSFTVPFYLDDRISIVENHLLYIGSVEEIWQAYGMRFIGYLTFWLNVQTSSDSLLFLHLTNYIIHLTNGLLVFVLVKLLARHVWMDLTEKKITLFSAIVATLWLLHPLNTQAVTYIVQRLASLVTLFYLVALYSYVKLKLERVTLLWSTVFVIFVIMGILTKQNFITLFVFIIFYELVFSEKKRQRVIIKIISLLIFLLALYFPFDYGLLQTISNLTKETTAISRLDYFNTQTVVLWLYIKKFFLPIFLQLDMGVELAKPSTGLHFLALVMHLLLIAFSIKMRQRVPLFTIGILFYYAGHSVESFIIPITDLAFEHRTYLPNIGLVLAFCALTYYYLANYSKLLVLISATASLAFTVVCMQRNYLWQNPYTFFQNEYLLSPKSPRAMEGFALQLININELNKAELLLTESVNSNLSQGKITVTGLNNLMLLLFRQEKYQAGINTAMVSLKYVKKPKDKSLILSTIAYGYIKMGWCDFARGLSSKAIKLDPLNQKANEYFEYCNKNIDAKH